MSTKERWYHAPTLKNDTYQRILKQSRVNLFPLISKRLETLELTEEGVSLAVLLAELLAFNKPEDGSAFYWCRNKPCFRPPVRYHVADEWESYTLLDFMRILNIPVDYVNKEGKVTKYGHFIILSAFLQSFAKYYEHLKCRNCGRLMKPLGITNFGAYAVTQFACSNESCQDYKKKVYLNHCFNKQNCNETIDSRDSKQCPNGQYICPRCGACCSTENFRRRLDNLIGTGGSIPIGLIKFVEEGLGHWEKQEFFCYKCGKPMDKKNATCTCSECKITYSVRQS